MSNHPSPRSSDLTRQNDTPTTQRVSPRHRITVTPGIRSTVSGQSTPSSIRDNTMDPSRSTQMRLNRMFSNSYRNNIRVNDTVAIILDICDENEGNKGNDGSMPERNEAPYLM